MVHFRFDSEKNAVAFGAAVDSALGYPREGVNVGAGVHAPEALSVTSSFYGPPRKHPTLEQWAFPYADDVGKLIEVTPELGKGAVLEERDPSWDPPPVELPGAGEPKP